MNYKKELGNVIREHRTKKQLSQEKLAEKCEMSTHQISDIENGKTNPKYDTVMKICDVCAINTGALPGINQQRRLVYENTI